ncbi:hypothetical protein L6164_034301 [Bauhinia variegata]|uniref:Uncharacterized protein n=1 Tax=Bauhinia variegata TaxID=167791 RepID=A0ACB9KUS3_BAUVA|nr:hypothetical protein L6164_034301 [Bauhinia variegata]
MGFFESSSSLCPSNQHCSKWAEEYMSYCLCSVKDGTSFALGVISVISWGVAEIPQLITNYKEKSAEGLSLTFLMTWLLGDLFNLSGCMLEPATLPTQYYMAVLYTITTLALASQSIYYGHIYPRLKYNRLLKHSKHGIVDTHTKGKRRNSDRKQASDANQSNGFDTSNRQGTGLSSPIPLPALPQISPGRELYYQSARYLSRSHTPTAGSVLAQRMTPPSPHMLNSIEEPLLSSAVLTQSAPALKIKTTLCLVSTLTLFGVYNLYQSPDGRVRSMVSKPRQEFVIRVGRKLFQVNGFQLPEHGSSGSSGIGSFLGSAMAAIYMGGRLPQICLNIKRGNVQGLNPLMFIFALVGNVTYVASILVSSLDWSKIRPNLPWLVDAGGCVLLDSFILIQFIYFHYRNCQDLECKCESVA